MGLLQWVLIGFAELLAFLAGLHIATAVKLLRFSNLLSYWCQSWCQQEIDDLLKSGENPDNSSGFEDDIPF